MFVFRIPSTHQFFKIVPYFSSCYFCFSQDNFLHNRGFCDPSANQKLGPIDLRHHPIERIVPRMKTVCCVKLGLGHNTPKSSSNLMPFLTLQSLLNLLSQCSQTSPLSKIQYLSRSLLNAKDQASPLTISVTLSPYSGSTGEAYR